MTRSRRGVAIPALGVLICCLLMFVPLACSAQQTTNDVSVLAVIGENYGANMFLYLNNFEMLGWDVTLSGLTSSIAPCPVYAKSIRCPSVVPDIVITDPLDLAEVDVLAVMPASGRTPAPYRDLLASESVLSMIAQADEGGTIITGQCYSAPLFDAAGILEGKTVLATDRYKELIEDAGGVFAGSPHPPLASGSLVSAVNGLYYNGEYVDTIALAVCARLFPAIVGDELSAAAVELSVSEPLTTNQGFVMITLGGASADGARDICQTSDGGLYIAGYTYSFGSGAADALIIKIDGDGTLEWARTLGGASRDEANAIIALRDGGCAVAGLTSSVGGGATDVLIARFASDGELMWARTYGGSGTEIAKSLCKATDTGFVVTGYVEDTGETMSDVLLLKFDESGVLTWAQTYGETNRPERGHSVIQTQSGGYFVSGTKGFDPPNRETYLLVTDARGRCQWEQTTGERAFDSALAASELPSGGFVVVGQQTLPDENLMKSTAFQIAADGSVIWNKDYGRSNNLDISQDVCLLDAETYAVVGGTDLLGEGGDEAWVRILTDGGRTLDVISYSEDGSEWLTGVCALEGMNLAAVGHTNSSGAGSFDVLLLRLAVSD